MPPIGRDEFLKDPYFLVESKTLPKWTSEPRQPVTHPVNSSAQNESLGQPSANPTAPKATADPPVPSSPPTDGGWDAVSEGSASGCEDNGTTAMQAESRVKARSKQQAVFKSGQAQRRRDQEAINNHASMAQKQREEKRLERKTWYETGGAAAVEVPQKSGWYRWLSKAMGDRR